jgi:hypothetical protein
MSTIPASEIVPVVPSVLLAGGTGLNGIGLILTRNTRVPIGTNNQNQPAATIQSFADEDAVAAYFGQSDPLVAEAEIYFGGFNGATIAPSALLIAQYNQTAVAAYLRGGNVTGLSLSQLQAISGSLSVVFDGYARSGTVNLASANSFSAAALLIQTALNSSLPQGASFTGSIAPSSASFVGFVDGEVLTVTQVTAGTIVTGGTLGGSGVTAGTTITGQLAGTPGGIGTYGVSAAQIISSESMTETYGTLTVSAVGSGSLAIGQGVSGTGVANGTQITQLGTGVGGSGTYYVNNTQTIGSNPLVASAVALTVSFDSVSGAFVVTSGVVGPASTSAFATGATAASLELTSATGAVLSQGAAPQTPATFMNQLIVTDSAWVNFMTDFDPDGGSGNTQKQAFAAWKDTQDDRFGYYCWDNDNSPAASSDAAASLGRILEANGDSGTLLIWEGGGSATLLDNGLCAFALGIAASVNYNQTNGRTTFAFRAQAGLVANVTDPTTAGNLEANGYNFYGAYGAANTNFIWFQTGQITGEFAWADSYLTQIWLNLFFQQQLLTMLQNLNSVPFNSSGASIIQQVCQTVIQAGLAFGAFAPNTLTPGQIAEVNQMAGASIAAALQSQGYYLQVNIPSQIVQVARGPWAITFWYIDRNSVQSIDLSSVLVQ